MSEFKKLDEVDIDMIVEWGEEHIARNKGCQSMYTQDSEGPPSFLQEEIEMDEDLIKSLKSKGDE